MFVKLNRKMFFNHGNIFIKEYPCKKKQKMKIFQDSTQNFFM